MYWTEMKRLNFANIHVYILIPFSRKPGCLLVSKKGIYAKVPELWFRRNVEWVSKDRVFLFIYFLANGKMGVVER